MMCLAACGEEPARETLNDLRSRGKLEEALTFLDRAKDDPTVSKEFKDVILYEQAVTYLHAARATRDPMQRRSHFDDGIASLRKFIDEHKTHELAVSARSQLASVQVEQAQKFVQRAKPKDLTYQERDELLMQARALFAEARKTFDTQREELAAKLKAVGVLDPFDAADAKQIKLRDQYRNDYLQARLVIPSIDESEADTYPPDSDARRELLRSAVDAYSGVYRDYRTRLAGLYARLYEGRCHAKLGDHRTALSIFNEILDQPDEPLAFRDLKKKVLTLAVVSWLDKSQAKYETAIDHVTSALAKLNPDEVRNTEWLYVRLALARAHHQRAIALKKNNAEDPGIATDLSEAREHAQFVAEIMSDHQKAARELLDELNDAAKP